MVRPADPLPLAALAPRRPGPAARSRGIGRLARLYPLGAFGGAVLLAMTLAAIFAPWLAPYDPLGTDYSRLIRPPNGAWIGCPHA